MTQRFGQLSYTSFETAAHMGGWQVKETSSDLSPDEIRALTAGVRTVFHPAQPLPAYPTAEQLEQGPRRLAYGRLDRQRAGYWHTVPAGADSTGRPGNVFAHAVPTGPRESATPGRSSGGGHRGGSGRSAPRRSLGRHCPRRRPHRARP